MSASKRAARKCAKSGIIRTVPIERSCDHSHHGPWRNEGVQNEDDGLDGRGLHLLQVLQPYIFLGHSSVRQIHHQGPTTWQDSPKQRRACDWCDLHVPCFKVRGHLPTPFKDCLREDSSQGYPSQGHPSQGARIFEGLRFLDWFRDTFRLPLNLLRQNRESDWKI